MVKYLIRSKHTGSMLCLLDIYCSVIIHCINCRFQKKKTEKKVWWMKMKNGHIFVWERAKVRDKGCCCIEFVWKIVNDFTICNSQWFEIHDYHWRTAGCDCKCIVNFPHASHSLYNFSQAITLNIYAFVSCNFFFVILMCTETHRDSHEREKM